MRISKCKNCKHYNWFFNSCNLYYQDVYIGEGDFDVQPINIKCISKSECKFESDNENET